MKKMIGFLTALVLLVFSLGHTAQAASYQVQSGDTLWKIASKHNLTVDQLVNHNRLNSTLLHIGQTLDVSGQADTYEVKWGDTFYSISLKLGVSMPQLKAANPQIENFHHIYPGQVLNVPYSGMIHMGPSQKKVIALTFDDGPEDLYTPQILDILQEKNVKATFFVLGQQVKAFPGMLKRIQAEGHAIGNHTWDHPDVTTLTEEQLIQTVQSTGEEIEKVLGYQTNLFRPPYGSINDQQIHALNRLGYRSIAWTIDTLDWDRTPADEILYKVEVGKVPGGIVLMHNFKNPGKLDGAVEALPQMIDSLRAQGYEFVTVPELLGE